MATVSAAVSSAIYAITSAIRAITSLFRALFIATGLRLIAAIQPWWFHSSESLLKGLCGALCIDQFIMHTLAQVGTGWSSLK